MLSIDLDFASFQVD